MPADICPHAVITTTPPPAFAYWACAYWACAYWVSRNWVMLAAMLANFSSILAAVASK